MKKIRKDRKDIVFYIKMFPLRSHPQAYKKSKAIVCAKSLKLLEMAYEGKQLPEPTCETTEVDDNIKLAEKLGITGTPGIILPDGAIVSGYKDAATLINLIDAAAEAAGLDEAPTPNVVITNAVRAPEPAPGAPSSGQ